jgi:hypothetical protein
MCQDGFRLRRTAPGSIIGLTSTPGTSPAEFYLDPEPGDGKYQITWLGMVQLPSLETDRVLEVIDAVLESGMLIDAFEPPDEDGDCPP